MIQIHGLDYNYKDGSKALRDVSLDLDQGGVVGIIGANGAGKSTLFMNMMGILRPNQGSVHFQGEPIAYNKDYLKKYRQQVGIVYQDPDKQIFFSNVYDDVAFALRNVKLEEKVVKKRVEKALTDMGLMSVREKPVHLLSYGQKKRVAIAGVLAMDSKVIMLDEPSAGLDPAMKEGIVQVIQYLCQEGRKVVVSSHDMDFIYRISDYVYVLHQGKNHGEGTPEEVFSQEEMLLECGLESPWLIKMHRLLEVPPFREEKDLYRYWSDQQCKSL